jgi:hypothetical protein
MSEQTVYLVFGNERGLITTDKAQADAMSIEFEIGEYLGIRNTMLTNNIIDRYLTAEQTAKFHATGRTFFTPNR